EESATAELATGTTPAPAGTSGPAASSVPGASPAPGNAGDASARQVRLTRRAQLRYDGTDTALQVPFGSVAEMTAAFEAAYRRQFSFLMRDKRIIVEAITVEAATAGAGPRSWVAGDSGVAPATHDHENEARPSAHLPGPAARAGEKAGHGA